MMRRVLSTLRSGWRASIRGCAGAVLTSKSMVSGTIGLSRACGGSMLLCVPVEEIEGLRKGERDPLHAPSVCLLDHRRPPPYYRCRSIRCCSGEGLIRGKVERFTYAYIECTAQRSRKAMVHRFKGRGDAQGMLGRFGCKFNDARDRLSTSQPKSSPYLYTLPLDTNNIDQPAPSILSSSYCANDEAAPNSLSTVLA